MTNTNRVTLSKGTINKLKKMGEPFESVDDCLKRILSCDCIQREMKKQQENDDEASGEEEE